MSKKADGGDAKGGEVEMEEKKDKKDKKGKEDERAEHDIAQADGSSVGEMKRSDYMIHIFIEKIKEIKCPPSCTLDPLIEVECLNIKKQTSTKKGIGGVGETTYSEHLFLEAPNVEKKDAEEAKIQIRLCDHGFFKNVVLGSFDFDLSYIYFMKDHIMLHKWLALSNPTSEDFAQITGYLKLSISVIAAGDEQIQITEDESLEQTDEAVLMPPQLNPKFYQIIVRIFQGQELTLTDMAIKFLRQDAKIDAYLMTMHKHRKLKTDPKVMKEAKQTKDSDVNQVAFVDWNQEIWIPSQIPVLSNCLIFRLMDEDTSGDETVGSILYDMKEIVEGTKPGQVKKGETRWKNVYGSPELSGIQMTDNKSIKKQMNESPELGSNWKGRILMQVECYETKKPVAKVEKIDQKFIEESNKQKNMKNYSILIEVGQAIALPKPKKYSIKFIIGGIVFQTKIASIQKNNYNRFSERIEKVLENGEKTPIWDVKLPYQNVQEFGLIFVLLMDGDLPVSYLVDNATNYDDISKSEYKWKEFKPDPYVGKVKNSNDAGMVSFKLCIHDQSAKKKLNTLKDTVWEKEPKKRQNPVKIRAYIYQCRDLPAADSNGTSDPFVKVWDMTEKDKKTSVIEDNNNPLYYETLELEYEVRDIKDRKCYPPFVLDVFDSDAENLIDTTDDYLARAIIYPEDLKDALVIQEDYADMTCDCDQKIKFLKCLTCQHTWELPGQRILPLDPKEKRDPKDGPKRGKPKWYNLYFAQGEPASGEILVSFAVSELDYHWQFQAEYVDVKSNVKTDNVNFDMLILGLRGLQSPGILPVKKAWIQFNLRNLVPPRLQDLPNIRTQPSASGPNPTLNTTMNFILPLPVDTLYCPKLSCAVYDNIIKGQNQPMIGSFAVDIGALMIKLRDKKAFQLKSIIEINKKLLGILKGEIDYPKDYGLQGEQNNNQDDRSDEDKEDDDSEGSFGVNESAIYESGQIDYGHIDSMESSTTEQLWSKTKKIGSSLTGKPKEYHGKKKRTNADRNNRSNKEKLQKDLKKGKGSEFTKDGLEILGPNEDDGNSNAFEQKESEKNQARNKRFDIQSSRYTKEIESPSGSESSVQYDFDLPHDSESEQIEKSDVSISKNESQSTGNSSGERSVDDILKTKEEDLRKQKELLEKEKNIIEEERLRSQEELNRNGDDGCRIVIMPRYKKDVRLKVDKEILKPPNSLFFPLGWDEDSKTRRKHYRQFYNDELENIEDIFPEKSPFSSFPIMRGQSRGLSSGGIMSLFRARRKKDASGQDSTVKCVGTFKGIMEIQQKDLSAQKDLELKDEARKLVQLVKEIAEKDGEDLQITLDLLADAMECRKLDIQLRQLHLSSLKITKCLRDLHGDEILRKRLLAKNKTTIRVYMIDAFDLASRDIGSASDPYLYLQCNDKIYNERSNYQLDEPNPQFYKVYDFAGIFPGSSPLQIDVYDYDDIFGDDLIGTSVLDLEDRYFSMEWQSLPYKPVESRQIYHQSSQISQGVVRCWVDLIGPNDPKKTVEVWDMEEQVYQKHYIEQWNITPKPPETFEVRIVVFNADGIPMEDWEGTSDVFFRGFFDTAEDVQETDTHYRNQDGKPDFQYRLIYQLTVPRTNYKYTLQCYDRDFFKSNDMIGEAQIDVKSLLEDCSLVKAPISLNEDYYKRVLKPHSNQVLEFDKKDKSRFWLKMKAKSKDKDKFEIKGKVKLQVDILPVAAAEKNPVGKARKDPNHSPTLPMPEGRISLSLNPWKMWKQMLGPAIRRKICIVLCLAVCCFLCLIMFPTLAADFVSYIIGSIFSGGDGVETIVVDRDGNRIEQEIAPDPIE